MAEVLAPVVDTVEKTLTPLGMMTGDYAVPKRMALGGVIGGMVVSWLKPPQMFAPNGRPRPWSAFQSVADANGLEPTGTPWFIGPILGALLLGVFI